MLSTMVVYAALMHSDQKDKGGVPYIFHVMAVAAGVTKYNDPELMCIAVGHDLFEDTSCTPDELRELFVSERVIRGIDALTKKKGQSYDDYVEGVLANVDAVLVKYSDVTHNMDMSRLNRPIVAKDLLRLEKYMILKSKLIAKGMEYGISL